MCALQICVLYCIVLQPPPTSTTATGPSYYRPTGTPTAATALTMPPTTSGQQPLTVQFVMPDGGTATRGGRDGCGQGRRMQHKSDKPRPKQQECSSRRRQPRHISRHHATANAPRHLSPAPRDERVSLFLNEACNKHRKLKHECNIASNRHPFEGNSVCLCSTTCQSCQPAVHTDVYSGLRKKATSICMKLM